MKGYINIVGHIGMDSKGIRLVDIVAQVQQQKDAKSFEVLINSGGGSLDEGFAIYDYLLSLNKPIKTIGLGIVASIATVIFAVGNERVLKPNTKFMVHLPSGSVEGTASYIEEYAKELKSAQTRLADFYKSKLGLTDEAIYPILLNETWLSHEDAKNIGFTTALEKEFIANFKIEKEMNLNRSDRKWLEAKFNRLLGKKGRIKAMTLTTADGRIVDFPKVEEGATPVVGDEATIDGEMAEGEILMSDNSTYVFDKGLLVEIISEISDETDETTETEVVEELKEEIEELKVEIEELKEDLEEAEMEIQEQIEEIKNFKSQIIARFNPGKSEAYAGKGRAPRGTTTKRKLFKN